MRQALYGTLVLCVALAACSSDSDTAGTAAENRTSPAETKESPTAFNIANQCVAIQSLANNKFISLNTDGSYGVTEATASNAAPFFLKPTSLGKYMIYNRDEAMMQAAGNTAGTPVNSSTAFSDAVEWAVQEDDKARGGFSLTNTGNTMKLVLLGLSNGLSTVESSGSSEETLFQFVETTGCAEFPEIATNTQGRTFAGAGLNKAVKGFADVHNHITATSFLGGAHHGTPHHRFGVTQALGSCIANHGPMGRLDLVDNLFKFSP